MPLHLLHAGMWETMQTESSLLRERDLGISLGKHNTDYICKQGQVLVLLFQQLWAPPSSCPRCHQRVPAPLCSPEFVWKRIWVFWKGYFAVEQIPRSLKGGMAVGHLDPAPEASQPPSHHGAGQEDVCAHVHVRTHAHIRQEAARTFSELFQQSVFISPVWHIPAI